MATLRAACIAIILASFFLIGMPVHRACRWRGARMPAGLVLLFCRSLLGIMRVGVEVRGLPAAGGRLVVANHVSWIDILALGSVEPVCFLAKREIATWPLIAGFAAMLDTVFVDRARRRCIPGVNREMAARLAAGRAVLLFPEGTTHDGIRLGRFGTSHLACLRDRLAGAAGLAACTAQPVRVTYSHRSAAWVGDATLVPHLWTILTGPRLTCTLAYGEPIAVPRGFDRKALGRQLAATVAGLRPPAETAPIPSGRALAMGEP